MLKALGLSVALVGVLAVGCSASEAGTDQDVGEANSTGTGTSQIARVYKPTCIEGEINLLTCETTNNKRLAVCARDVTNRERGYIEYRYGTMARGSEMTITYPSQYTDDSEPAIEVYELRFNNGNTHYDVYSLTGGSYNQAGITIRQGTNPAPVATVECKTDGPTGLRLGIETVREAGVRNVPVDSEGRGEGRGG